MVCYDMRLLLRMAQSAILRRHWLDCAATAPLAGPVEPPRHDTERPEFLAVRAVWVGACRQTLLGWQDDFWDDVGITPDDRDGDDVGLKSEDNDDEGHEDD